MNLANKITLLRILMVPVFLVIALIDIPVYGDFLAACIFALAAATDGVDGHIARSRNQITTFGKFMDPLADKLLVCSALVALVQMGRLDAWIPIVVISREFAVMGLRAIAAAQGEVIAASKLGKLKTVSQIVAILALFLQYTAFFNTAAFHVLTQVFVYAAVFFTVYSGVDYIAKGWVFLFPKRER